MLDDVHLLRSRECLSDLGFLVLHAPDTLRLVLGARADPALPLHVLRVRGRLIEIRAADLAFTEAEAARAARRARARRSRPSWSRALCARTEGWGAGLRLAALSLQGRDDPERFVAEFAGDDRVVGDYLLAEVLDRQPPRLRAFLLRTSIVDRVCGELADALTGQGSSSGHRWPTLERTNGFVLGVDSRREWYRYHRLFAKLLRTRARRELGARAAAAARPRGALVRRARDGLGGAASTPSPRSEWDLAVELVAEHWFDALRPRPGRRDPRARRRAAGRPAARPTPSSAAALACAALRGRRRRGRRGRTSRTRARPPSRRCPPRAAAATWRRWRSRACTARAWRATSRPRSSAADELLAEAAVHGGWSDDARQALVHAHARARPRCGRTGSTAPREELEQGVEPGARRRARLRRGLGAQRRSRCST